MVGSRTVGFVKPHAVTDGHVGEIISTIERHPRLELTVLKRYRMDQSTAQRLYVEHLAQSYFGRLVESVIGRVYLMEINSLGDAVVEWRDLIGPTDPERARITAPRTIRAKFGTELPYNAVHGASDPEAAMREMDILFRHAGA